MRRFLLTCSVFGIFSALLFLRLNFAYATEISEVKVSDLTDKSASVAWKTDLNADGMINYGLDSNFGIVRDPTFTTKDHLLKIENLDPATTYHFRVISTDESGNKSATAGFVFTTKAANKDNASENILKQLKKIIDPKELKKVQEQVKDVANDIVKPPTILGATKVVADIDRADISWICCTTGWMAETGCTRSCAPSCCCDTWRLPGRGRHLQLSSHSLQRWPVLICSAPVSK